MTAAAWASCVGSADGGADGDGDGALDRDASGLSEGSGAAQAARPGRTRGGPELEQPPA